ncbi:MAG: hypothetical protein ACK5NT_15610 [Pyrinomonadaceae bacterium]
MSILTLVKPLSQLKEERRISRENAVEIAGLRLLRGSTVEFAGATSTGKTGYVNAILAKLTNDGEVCAVIDTSDSFDPVSANAAGVVPENLLWVRCGGDIESAMKSGDLLLQAKGFGAVWINFGRLSQGSLSYVPNSFWYRFRTLVKGSPTLLLVTAKYPVMGSAAQHSYAFSATKCVWKGESKFKLIKEFRVSIGTRQPMPPVIARMEQKYLPDG